MHESEELEGLRAQVALLKAAMQCTETLVCMLDAAGKVMDCNPAWSRYFAPSRVDLTERRIAYLDLVWEVDP